MPYPNTPDRPMIYDRQYQQDRPGLKPIAQLNLDFDQHIDWMSGLYLGSSNGYIVFNVQRVRGYMDEGESLEASYTKVPVVFPNGCVLHSVAWSGGLLHFRYATKVPGSPQGMYAGRTNATWHSSKLYVPTQVDPVQKWYANEASRILTEGSPQDRAMLVMLDDVGVSCTTDIELEEG